MTHPFDLNLSDLETVDLDFEERLTDEETANVGGGILPGGCVTTQAIGEEGGYNQPPIIKKPRPITVPPKEEPIYTTLALGEEGGDSYTDM